MKRERLHRAIRSGDLDEVKRMVDTPDGPRLTMAKNYFGRSALHIAVLKEREDIVYYLATKIKSSLRLGDNVCHAQRILSIRRFIRITDFFHFTVGTNSITLCYGRQ